MHIYHRRKLKNCVRVHAFIYRPTCTTHAHTAKKLTKKKSRERSSSGSAVFSLGMSGGAVKKTRNVTRKASKSPRRTAAKKSPRQELRRKAVKNSSRIKSKRASKPIVRKKTRTKKPAGGRPFPRSSPMQP